ncbi:MAG: hypothetical protein WDA08_07385 [Weeksellaceae bacterium]
MKKLILLLVICSDIISCQFSERLYLMDSGKVNYEYEVDFSAMASMMISAEGLDSMKKIGEYPIDQTVPLTQIEQLKFLKIDTLTPKQKEYFKTLNKTKAQLVLNDNVGKLSFITEENSVDAFNAYTKKAKAIVEEMKKEKTTDGKSEDNFDFLIFPNFEYNGKTFKRIANIENLEKGIKNDSLIEAAEILNAFRYKIEYHFPKEIKKTSLDSEGKISPDGKTILVDMSLTELFDNPEKYNFKLDFK